MKYYAVVFVVLLLCAGYMPVEKWALRDTMVKNETRMVPELSGSGERYTDVEDVKDVNGSPGDVYNSTEEITQGGGGVGIDSMPLDMGGLAAYWKFDDVNAPGRDYGGSITGSAKHLVLYNGATQVGNTKFGRALQFDGEEDFAQVNDGYLWSSPSGIGDVMVEAWLFPRTWDQTGTIFYHGDNGEIHFRLDNTHRLMFSVKVANYNNWYDVCWDPGFVPEPNRWYHVAGYWGYYIYYGVLRLYVNGELVAVNMQLPGQYLKDVGSNYKAQIGAKWENGYPCYYYNGIMDEVRVMINRQERYDVEGATVARWNMNEGAGNITRDRSGCGHTGALQNSPSWVDSRYGYEKALSFNRVNSQYVQITDQIFNRPSMFSFECMIKPQQPASGQVYTVFYNAQGGEFVFQMDSVKLYFKVHRQSGWATTEYTVPQWNTWYFVQCRFKNNDTIALYINGLLADEESLSSSTWYTGGSNTYIGKGWMGEYYSGIIDEIRISNIYENNGTDVLKLPFEDSDNYDPTTDQSIHNNDVVNSGLTWNSTGGKYGGCYMFDGQEQHYLYDASVDSEECPTTDARLTVEAWIYPVSFGTWRFILDCKNGYKLYLSDAGKLVFEYRIGQGGSDIKYLYSQRTLSINQWYHVMATLECGTIVLYIDGVYDNSVRNPSYRNITYYNGATRLGIGASWDGYYSFYGRIDNVRISNHVRDLTEDLDGDGMPDLYEIMRSKFSDQFDPVVHNGRYALLVAPIRLDSEIQFKYDITQMYFNLLSWGWYDDDIIFLTSSSNHGDLTKGNVYNGGWIDGEAFHNNLDGDAQYPTAFDALQNGGSYRLRGSSGWSGELFFPVLTSNDSVLIYLRDHGTENWEFCTYNINYETQGWASGDFDDELDGITCKYMICVFDFCYSGGFMTDCDDNDNRIIVTSQNNRESNRYAYLFYGRIRGNPIDVEFSVNGIIHDESEADYDYCAPYNGNEESATADGISGVNGSRERITNNNYLDKIISITEAHYMADIATNDRYGNVQTPFISIGNNIPAQVYF